MSKSITKSNFFLAKTGLFVALTFGVNVAYAEYWIDSPPIAPVGCSYVYAYGSSSCKRPAAQPHKYKKYSAKGSYYRNNYPRVNYRVEAYYYGPVVPVCNSGGCQPVQVACTSCGCGACGGPRAVEYVRSDGSYYSEVIMGGYPTYPYVNYSYSTDQATGDDSPKADYNSYVTYSY